MAQAVSDGVQHHIWEKLRNGRVMAVDMSGSWLLKILMTVRISSKTMFLNESIFTFW